MQFYVPNQQTQPEEYAHHMLFMYYPFRNENDLKSGNPPTYINKLRESNVIRIKIVPELSHLQLSLMIHLKDILQS